MKGLKERLLYFIEYKGLPVQMFEKIVGLSNAAVSKMGDNTRRSTIDKISKSFPELDVNWLLMGGTLTGFAAPGAMLQNCEAIISPIEDVDFAITVYGDSMAPEYPSGSRILIKKINPNIFIDWGKTYVLDTANGVIV